MDVFILDEVGLAGDKRPEVSLQLIDRVAQLSVFLRLILGHVKSILVLLKKAAKLLAEVLAEDNGEKLINGGRDLALSDVEHTCWQEELGVFHPVALTLAVREDFALSDEPVFAQIQKGAQPFHIFKLLVQLLVFLDFSN